MTNPTPHGQVPEALRLAEEISNLVCSSEAAAKTIAAAADELCRLHVENASLRAALAASPTPPAEQQAAQVIIDFSQVGTAGPFPVVNGRVSLPDATMQDLARMLRPTYEAEQQAQPGAVYAELPAPTASIGIDDAWHEPAMRDFADRTHALRMEQAAPQPAPAPLSDSRITAIEQAIRDYHYALDTRQHGGIAATKAFDAICSVMEMQWLQGQEAARRAALAAQGGKT